MPLPTHAVPAAAAASAPTLAAMRGRKRVVVVFAPSDDDPRLAEQRRTLGVLTRGGDDRDLAFVAVTDGTSGAADTAADLRRRLHAGSGAFVVLLIGKDGREALRRDRPVDATELAALIDAMPMRRDEVRRR